MCSNVDGGLISTKSIENSFTRLKYLGGIGKFLFTMFSINSE